MKLEIGNVNGTRFTVAVGIGPGVALGVGLGMGVGVGLVTGQGMKVIVPLHAKGTGGIWKQPPLVSWQNCCARALAASSPRMIDRQTKLPLFLISSPSFPAGL